MTHVVDSPIPPRDAAPRRSFLVRCLAVVLGGIAALFPFAAGLGVLISPLRKRQQGAGDASDLPPGGVLARIGTLDSIPADGLPRAHVLTADVTDAWTRTPGQRIGVAYIARAADEAKPHITAFTATCPHLGCAVDFEAAEKEFICPCHKSAFAEDGKKLYGPSLRGLDPLEVRLVDSSGQTEVWVVFQRFRAGIAERVPIV
jgi:menaquinol-cytochrome c reductase iron-sulfur subunit